MRGKIIVFTLLFATFDLLAQYSPQLDIRGTDDTTDGAEFQLATPSETNFLRFYSGRVGDPNPHLYFSNQDTFKIANGDANFSKFKESLNINPEGNITINDLIGTGERFVTVDATGMLKASATEGSSFSAQLMVDSTLENGTEYSLINWFEIHDDSDNYDPVTGIYTSPEDGVYLFQVRCNWQRDDMDLDNVPILTRFMLNGQIAPLGQTTQRVSINQNYGEHTLFSINLRLLAGDAIGLRVTAITGGPTILLNGSSFPSATSISGTRIN